jgi:hypothetical protein
MQEIDELPIADLQEFPPIDNPDLGDDDDESDEYGNAPKYLPTPEQIAAECLAIQSGWSNSERRRRAGRDGMQQRWLPPGADRFGIFERRDRRPPDASETVDATETTREAACVDSGECLQIPEPSM